MFNFLLRFTNSGKISAATLKEQRACLEAVILTLCSDRLLTFMEQWEFQQLVKRIRWRFNAKTEIPDIRERACAALQDAEKLSEYLEGINENISDEEVGKAIFKICYDISYDSWYQEVTMERMREVLLSPEKQLKNKLKKKDGNP